MSKDQYIEIESALRLKLILAVQLELGRDLTSAEEDRLASLITDRDVAGMMGD